MRKALLFFLGAVLVLPLIGFADTEENSETFNLKFQGLTKWDFWTPHPETVAAGKASTIHLALPGRDGAKIRVEIKSNGIWVDTNGDGLVDVKDERGFLSFPLEYDDGTKGVYRVLLRKDKNGWNWTRFCVMKGKVKGTPITLIDENHNGVYGEVGKDTMLIGKEDTASYVSAVVNLKGKLFNIEVSPSGSKITATPYEGPTGVLDLTSGYRLKGKVKSRLRMAMVQQGEDRFFNLAEKGKKYRIPAGEYDFLLGLVGSGKTQMADIETGRLPAFTVKEDEVTTHKWGIPGEIEFSASSDSDGNITIQSSGIEIYGIGGEIYKRFKPKAFTPRIQVREKRSKKLLVNKSMGAGC